MRLFSYVVTTFIIPIIIFLLKLVVFAMITVIIPLVINTIKNKLNNQERLLCNKCKGKLEVIDKEGNNNLYCKNCKIIKFDRH